MAYKAQPGRTWLIHTNNDKGDIQGLFSGTILVSGRVRLLRIKISLKTTSNRRSSEVQPHCSCSQPVLMKSLASSCRRFSQRYFLNWWSNPFIIPLSYYHYLKQNERIQQKNMQKTHHLSDLGTLLKNQMIVSTLGIQATSA